MTRIGGFVGNDAAARAASLIAVAEELAGEFSLRPLLEQILRRSTELLECDAGSICSVDEAAGVYRKEADIGVACNSGAVYPLTEGMTGAVVARRAPLWFARYDDVPGGHVAAESRATLRGVIGVPLEWRGRIIGACIVFSRDDRRTFGTADAELLRLFARHAAIALANARMHEEADKLARSEAAAAERDRMLAELHDTLARRLVSVRAHVDNASYDLGAGAGAVADGAAAEQLQRASAIAAETLVEVRLTLLGLAASPLDGRTLEAALRSEVAWAQSTGHLEVRFVSAGTPVALAGDLSREVLRTAREALTNIVAHARARTARLGLLYESEAVSLLVQDDGQGFDPRSGWQSDRFGLRAMADRASALGATVDLDSLPGWGTRIRARFPYRRDAGAAPARPRVLVAARQPALRAGLARLLTWTEPGLEIIGEAATAEEAVEACRALRPEVALVDLGLFPAPGEPGPVSDGLAGPPDGDGITGQLIRVHEGLAVVGICDTGGEQADDQVARAMRAGARGCVDTEADGLELAQAVVAAARGQAILSGPMLRQLRRGLRADEALEPLTSREREVRGLMEQGLPDKIIAERLMLSVKTIEKHAGAVLRKTGARNRTELAGRAASAR
ncbi:MAG TPA: GAF domain-containing protein [Streptosporangiaceae bacterium]|jgi:signal transduction histidine kinase/DNA-binding NarL/FixJ family response regulator